MTLMLNTYTVTVMATHVVLEVYVIRSELSYNDILEDLKGDPFQLYCGDDVRMVEDEFLECQRLNLLDVEETPNA
jgi:hypothetical protein